MKTITMKFGGTSVGSVAAIQYMIDIVREAQSQADGLAVIASAMSGVTDLLQESVIAAAEGDASVHQGIAETLLVKHTEVIETLIPNEAQRAAVRVEIRELVKSFTRFCDSVSVIREASPRARDYIMSLGERLSVRQLAAVLNAAGIPAEFVDSNRLVLTDDTFQNAAPYLDETRTQTRDVLLPILEAGKVAIITGFIGGTADGKITTLGRGGSDYSAGIVGSCLDSEEIWIWTDVDGVMSADPRVVKDARSIRELTYREVSELAYFGAKVLHPRTLRPLADVPLRVKNTFNAAHPGTLVIPDIAQRSPESERVFKAVTAIRSMSMLVVEGKGMLGVPGIAARTFGAVARTGTSVLLISQSSSEQSICFIVPANSIEAVQLALDEEFKQELARGDIDSINCMPDINIVTVVGEGMRNIPGIAGRVFTATGDNGINVIAIAQGSSECSISLVVDAASSDAAVRAIHTLAAD